MALITTWWEITRDTNSKKITILQFMNAYMLNIQSCINIQYVDVPNLIFLVHISKLRRDSLVEP